MAGSNYGTIFHISTWGESHGKGVGVVIDGCPAGLSLCEEDIQIYLNRRKPGQNMFSTPRKEDDTVEILSGIFEGKTTGTPISLVVFNKNQCSKDYGEIASYFRPGHADFTFTSKYGFRDYRGGGRSSGRETIGRVAAGAIASKLLLELGISVKAYSKEIGGISINTDHFDENAMNTNAFYMPDKAAAEQVEVYLKEKIKEHNSVGGIIECVINGMPVGIGETTFEKLDANLAKSIMSIGAVKGFEIGAGFACSKINGSENNDEFHYNANGNLLKTTNNSGGVLGGMSDGSEIIFRAAIKPTPSIGITQKTVNLSQENIEIEIGGRHDPIIVPRAVVVVEAMAALTIIDMLLVSMTARVDNIKRFFDGI